MTEKIKRFGVDYLPKGMGMQRRSIYADTAEGNRLWIVDASDIYYTATQVLVDLLNAGLAAQDMLKALEDVDARLTHIGHMEANALTHGIVRAAIAKAKGARE